jgi:hypothetical protein
MSFDKQNFKTNPNFKFREYPVELRECLGTTYTYDVYKDKQGRAILITPYWNINKQCNTEGDPSVGLEKYHYISLIDLSNNEEIQTLVGHTDRVVTCRFFEDPFTKKHYLISADRKYKVKVWDLTDNGKIVFDKELKEGYDNFIYSVLMIFEQNKIYVVTSTLGSGETNVFVIGSDEAPKKLKDTKDLNIYYLDYWFEEKDADGNSEHHIIQCGKNKILISQLKKDSNYEIATEEKYANNLCGMVYKKGDKDLLITSATRGLIEIIDLKERKELQKIEHSDVFFYNFVRWNDQYILLYEAMQRRILVLDTDNNYKVVSKVLCPEMYYDRFIRKVDHPKYGESILSVGIDWKVKLYTNRNIVKEEVKEEEKEGEKGENKIQEPKGEKTEENK